MKKQLFLILFVLANSNFFLTNVFAFSGTGNGVSGDAYIITTAEQLAEIANASSAYYELGNDIPLTGDWTPIASFSGTLDGKGHFITNLQINSTSNNIGLFAQASGSANIKNLGIVVAEGGIKGATMVAAIVGRTDNATSTTSPISISNCFVTGNIESLTGANVGSIIGYNTTSISISNCYAIVSISSETDGAGGIVGNTYVSSGSANSLTVENCYVIGSINASNGSAGGIAGGIGGGGSSQALSATISNCASMCSTITAKTAKRIAAYIKSSVATVTYNNNIAYDGTLVNGTAVSSDNNQNGLNKTKSELKTQAAYPSWDFTGTWTLGNGNYPFPVLTGLGASNQPTICPEYLGATVDFLIPTLSNGSITVDPATANIGQSVTITVTPNSGYRLASFTIDGVDKTADLSGNTLELTLTKDSYTLNASFTDFTGEGKGTPEAPFIITSEAELNWVRNSPSAYYQLENDIDLTTWLTANSSTEGWNPLPFAGHFNGNGHFITGLWINRPTTNNVGLFGNVTGNAEISNLGVSTATGTVKGQNNVGILVGNASGGTLTISNCAVSGNAEATTVIGALLGYNNGGNITITNSYATGSIVSAGDGAGGLIGNNWAGASATINISIQNSYAVNSVSGTGSAGGLMGGASASGTTGVINLSIQNSYAINPTINTTSTSCGRIYGYLKSTTGTTILANNGAYEGILVKGVVATGGTADNKDGLDQTAKELAREETFADWDFNTVWTIGNNSPDGATYYPLPVLKTLPAGEQASVYPEHLKYDVQIITSATGNGIISAHSGIKSGDDVTITFTDKEVQEFLVNGEDKKSGIASAAYRIENILDNYSISVAFEPYTVAAGGSNTANNYLNGDILFYSDDTNGTGELIGISAEGLPVNGVVKLIQSFTETKWYPIGFPFEIASVTDAADETVLAAYNGDENESEYTGNGNGDYWIKWYDGEANLFKYPGADFTMEPDKGYIIQFPDFYAGTTIEVIFTSTPNPLLKNTNVTSQTLSATTDNHGYYLVANPSVATIASLTDVDHYYKYDVGNNRFGLLPEETENIDLKPFEAIVAVKKLASGNVSLRTSLGTGEGNPGTGLEQPAIDNATDPVIETKYYNLQGVEIRQPAVTNIYIVKKIHASGRTEIAKRIYHLHK
jgi:hypothetical protein